MMVLGKKNWLAHNWKDLVGKSPEEMCAARIVATVDKA
jgi:hypothetical protein